MCGVIFEKNNENEDICEQKECVKKFEEYLIALDDELNCY